ncbi:hypothetical protein LY90DRAFT_375764 [Neocallimastix californiae]|uniref:Ubiquitin-like domain-containing protein n=1 Tax=Neocallimastix californiae TaxID=1754190 RepID=A0A1Y2FCH4_9FUNG|nr:hypothetical protein LY90DRAFT_375764 [Neocallimastix californiae]|eukprot:ORY81630.1 hypothetical protein LY90DRAFT_375764 [Neocallimastix californiae]
MSIDPITIFEITSRIYDECRDLNDSYKKYINHSEYINRIALKVKEKYRNEKNTPEILKRFYDYTIEFKEEIDKLKKQNRFKRTLNLFKNKEKLDEFIEKFNMIEKELTFDIFMVIRDDYEPKQKLAEQEEYMIIFVEIFRRKIITLSVKSSDTIKNVKNKIQNETDIPPKRQLIFYTPPTEFLPDINKIFGLEDERTLSYYNIQEGSTLELHTPYFFSF